MSSLVESTWRRDMANANLIIEKREALRTDDDGFQWLDVEKLPDWFGQFYAEMTSIGYANGWVR